MDSMNLTVEELFLGLKQWIINRYCDRFIYGSNANLHEAFDNSIIDDTQETTVGGCPVRKGTIQGAAVRATFGSRRILVEIKGKEAQPWRFAVRTWKRGKRQSSMHRDHYHLSPFKVTFTGNPNSFLDWMALCNLSSHPWAGWNTLSNDHGEE